MRIRQGGSRDLLATTLVALLAIASAPAEAQSTGKADEAALRALSTTARPGLARSTPVAHATVRAIAGDTTPLVTTLVTPYRSTPSQDAVPGGFAMRVPGTGLDLTDGSLSIHHANDGRNGKGLRVSVQLTY